MRKEDLAAMVNAGTNRQGAVVRDDTGERLTDTEVTGPRGGLTRKGTITRQREMDWLMEELFPL